MNNVSLLLNKFDCQNLLDVNDLTSILNQINNSKNPYIKIIFDSKNNNELKQKVIDILNVCFNQINGYNYVIENFLENDELHDKLLEDNIFIQNLIFGDCQKIFGNVKSKLFMEAFTFIFNIVVNKHYNKITQLKNKRYVKICYKIILKRTEFEIQIIIKNNNTALMNYIDYNTSMGVILPEKKFLDDFNRTCMFYYKLSNNYVMTSEQVTAYYMNINKISEHFHNNKSVEETIDVPIIFPSYNKNKFVKNRLMINMLRQLCHHLYLKLLNDELWINSFKENLKKIMKKSNLTEEPNWSMMLYIENNSCYVRYVIKKN